MAKGITDLDVWHAADALLLDGQRPTIERVRQHIGRGSPNTVSPHLDTWFSRLGARIADPQAFRAPAPDTPEPVQALAAQLWDTAQALARGQAETRALAAETLQRQAQAAADDLRAELDHQRARADTLATDLDALQRAHAAAHAALAERAAAHTRELADAHAQRDALRTQAQADITAAAERATAAERRAAADMDRERQARLHAEQLARDARAESDRALAAERARSQAQFIDQVQALAKIELRASALQERLDRVEAERLRVKLRARRADSAGGGSPSASRARGAR
ncbi:DNA-binding protein [Sphaerotilus montanus]|uniref:DNA-binding protein n=1 Tax=Sphaerotilus montanus TaxID=522889 RepID=UPI003FA298BD